MTTKVYPKAATVTGSGAGWYQVQTDSGQSQRVVSPERWPVGTRVLILSGSIIGLAGPAKAVQVFEV